MSSPRRANAAPQGPVFTRREWVCPIVPPKPNDCFQHSQFSTAPVKDQRMRLGMVGLGRMGANMTTRLLRGSHAVVVYDPDAEAVANSAAQGAARANSLADLVTALSPPRIVWLMIPAGTPTETTIDELLTLLAPGDIVIDGGNSRWTDSKLRYARCKDAGVGFIDAGTSGGVWGLANGYCLMVGGDEEALATCWPIFHTLAPKDGFAHVG